MLYVSARDLLVCTRRYALENKILVTISRSIQNQNFPEFEGKVRAQLALGGYYVQPFEIDQEGYCAEVTMVSKANPKGYLPLPMMKNLSAREIPKRANLLHTVMSKYYPLYT